jgi:hypothetical protein
MKIQPGTGYTFDSSSKGFTLDTSNPFPDRDSIEPPCVPLRVNYGGYETEGNTHFFNVCIGAVNNLIPQIEEDGVWIKLDRQTEGVPNPPKSVINVTAGLGVIYLRCGNNDEAETPVEYPVKDDEDVRHPRIISAGGTSVPSDSNDYSYLLLATVLIDENEKATLVPVVMNSLWTARFQCGTDIAEYFWSTI